MLGTILRKDSPLKKLCCFATQDMDNREGGSIVSAIMKALEVNTTLRHLINSLYGVSDEVREALQTGLPKLRGLEHLSCSVCALTMLRDRA